MRVLITGGLGYMGGRLAQHLATLQDYEVLIGSRKHAKRPSWLPRGAVVQTQWGSLADLEHICTDIDAVVHAAGMNAEDSAADPIASLAFNGVATARLLQAATRKGVRRFVYLSTAHVYGSPLAGAITEDTCSVSLHPYATSHRAGEDLVRAAHQRGEIEGIVVRLSNAYGAPAHEGANCWMLLVNDLCRQAVATQRMVLRSSGLERRDFISLTDACRAIRHLLELPAPELRAALFNVGGIWSPTIFEMTQRIAERVLSTTGDTPEILREEQRDGQVSEFLDYGVTRLTSTGFNVSCGANIDREIDLLIQFCLKHFARRS